MDICTVILSFTMTAYRDDHDINYYFTTYRKVLALVLEFDQQMNEFMNNSAALLNLTSVVSFPVL